MSSEVPTPLAIYVHWPWCKAKCPYCDFNSHAGTPREEEYLNALLKEFAWWGSIAPASPLKTAPFDPSSRRIVSIFFGGGTPSLMKPSTIQRIIAACARLGTLDDATEITLECNPTSFDSASKSLSLLEDFRSAGINRISIGIQGLKQEWLTFLGREHSPQDAFATLDAAQKLYDNVNADVIYGLPQQSLQEWQYLLESLSQRGLAHISAYQLTIEKNTSFYSDVKRGVWTPASADEEADFFDLTRVVLGDRGYINYEISNFAVPEYPCQHNLHVWNYGEYLGLGAGAHGRVLDTNGRVVATQVVRQPEGYLHRLNGDDHAFSRTERLASAEAAQEAVFSGLRLKTGIDSNSLQKRFGAPAWQEAVNARETAFLSDTGFLTQANGQICLTEAGWPRLNSVLQRILPRLDASPRSVSTTSDAHPSAYNSAVSVVIE